MSGEFRSQLMPGCLLSRTFKDWVRKVLVNVKVSNKKGCSLKRWLLVEYTVSIHFMPCTLILL